MNRHESLPEPSPYSREAMALTALQFNVFEMSQSAHRRNRANIAEMRALGRSTAQRLVMLEIPSETTSLRKQPTPVACERIVLVEPRKERQGQLIVRIPFYDSSPTFEESLDLPGVFIEQIDTPRRRQRYLLNGGGLWRYNSAADIGGVETGDLYVEDVTAPEPTSKLEELSKQIAEYGFAFQNSIVEP